MISLEEFIVKYDGKTKGYPNDSSYQGECLSIVKLYIKECFGINPPPSGSNSAYGYWSNFPDPLGSVFTKVPNTPTGVPQRGDIPIWEPTASNTYGHINIFLEGDANQFTGFDQNFYGRHAHKQKHNYNNVVGWLHPRGSSMSDKIYSESEMTAVREERDRWWNLLQKILEEIENSLSK